MEDFTVSTRLSTKQYVRLMFAGLYKKPVFVITSLFGLGLLTTAVLCYMHVSDYYTYSPFTDLCLGVFLLLMPTLIVLITVRQFSANPSFKHDIAYTFGERGIAVHALTFKAEFSWTHITKQKELGKFLILYHNNKFGNFIDKTKLNASQLQYFKFKVSQK